jgi:DNA-binding IscR family transcriptional regulator
MRYDSRLSGVLHVLLHMAERDLAERDLERGLAERDSAQPHRPMTSDMLAKAMGTNPVVIRRIMAGLRERGYVQSEKGHGGGWTLACDLTKVTLRDVYNALGCPSLLAIGNRSEAPQCLVEQAVNASLNQAFRDAEALLLSRLDGVTLAALSADFHARLAARGNTTDAAHRHAS